MFFAISDKLIHRLPLLRCLFGQWHNRKGYEWDIEASLPSISFLVILGQDVVPASLPNQGYDPLFVGKIGVAVIGE